MIARSSRFAKPSGRSGGRAGIYWLYAGKDGSWYLRREGGGVPPCWRSFAPREAAVTAIQLSAARCMSYCLYVQDADGNVTLEQAVAPNR